MYPRVSTASTLIFAGVPDLALSRVDREGSLKIIGESRPWKLFLVDPDI